MRYSANGTGENALQKVVFVVQFSEYFTNEDFQNFDRVSNGWRTKLSMRSVSNGVVVDPVTMQAVSEVKQPFSAAYETLTKDGPVEFGLKFEANRILFLVGSYTRWAKVWPRAQKYLREATALVPETNSVSSYAVEYTDLFRASEGEYSEFQPSEFLRKGSQYVPEHVFNGMENWHFDIGCFHTYNKPEPHMILTRIQANLEDNNEEKSRDLSIVLMHQFRGDRESWVGHKKLPDSIRDRALENFEVLHELDKKILGEIINDTMAKEIGLNQ